MKAIAATALGCLSLLVAGGARAYHAVPEFTFAILGDRTGGASPDVYAQVWRDIAKDRPEFVVTVGDAIQGGNDHTVDQEWRGVFAQLAPYRRRFKIFFTPGNHDVWSDASAAAFVKYSGDRLHYGFDFKQTHFTVLDNSRSEAFTSEELSFLESDLKQHQNQPVKFILSHRPSWILQAVLGNPSFPLHRLAKKYGVRYVIAGHVHQMLHFDLDGVTYLSMPSSGGHLRDTKAYESGWFYAHTLVNVRGESVEFSVRETGAPFGKGRVTKPEDWGAAGLR